MVSGEFISSQVILTSSMMYVEKWSLVVVIASGIACAGIYSLCILQSCTCLIKVQARTNLQLQSVFIHSRERVALTFICFQVRSVPSDKNCP